jgi:imidazolonepropionase-like amidohydrolase
MAPLTKFTQSDSSAASTYGYFLRGIEQEIKEAMSLGVQMESGFDASEVGRHGENAKELVGLVRRGLAPVDAIRGATVNAAELSGW